MGNIFINSNELSTVSSLAESSQEKISTSYDRAEKLFSSGSGSDQTWTGESKDSYMIYLDIIKGYHKDLATCLKDYKHAVDQLKKNMDSYDSDEMSKVRDI